MSQYLLRFRVESCLTCPQDLTLSYAERHVTFLFSQKRPEETYVYVRVGLEATNNRLAQEIASSKIVPPVLDALSFSTGTPLLLGECDLILKDEAGSQTRRAIYVGNRRTQLRVPLTAEAIQDARGILSLEGAPRLPLCWHRYALDRQLAPEQFVFQWLAFEGLAGDADIASRCPKCRKSLEHCGVEVKHRGSNKTAARDVFLAANPATTPQEFNERVWSKARNSIFHGRKYPEPEYLAELRSLTGLLSRAAQKQIATLFRLGGREIVRRPYADVDLVFLFIQWRTGDRTAQYAADWPARVFQQVAREEPEGIAAAIRDGIDLLNYNNDSPDW